MHLEDISAFQKTFEKSSAWIQELNQLLAWDSEQKAYLGLRSVFHALRNRLTVEEAADFAAQLPMLLRGLFYEGYKPHGQPLKEKHLDQFLAHVAEYFPKETPEDVQRITKAVFQLIQKHVPAGEVKDIKANLPAELRQLWD